MPPLRTSPLLLILLVACAAQPRPRSARIELAHSNAAELQHVLTELLGDRTGKEPPVIATDAASNSLIVSGDPARIAEVEDIVAQLDRPFDTTPDTLRVDGSSTVDKTTLHDAVRRFLEDEQRTHSSSRKPGSPVRRRRPIVVRENAGILILEGPKVTLDRIRRMIDELESGANERKR